MIERRGRNNGRMGVRYCTDADGNSFKIGTGLKDYMRDKPPAIGTCTPTINFIYARGTRQIVNHFFWTELRSKWC